MAFDLTNKNVSDTFQHLLQVRDSDKTIYDAVGNVLDDFRLSGSFTTSEFLELENTDSVTGNKLHSRGGTLYWGNTNLETGCSGLSNMVEDTTPQLGGNLDINSKDVNGDGTWNALDCEGPAGSGSDDDWILNSANSSIWNNHPTYGKVGIGPFFSNANPEQIHQNNSNL